MALNPKNVQQAVRLANALANPSATPVLREQDWNQIRDRFQLDDHLLTGVKLFIETACKHPELRTVLACLTHNA